VRPKTLRPSSVRRYLEFVGVDDSVIRAPNAYACPVNATIALPLRERTANPYESVTCDWFS